MPVMVTRSIQMSSLRFLRDLRCRPLAGMQTGDWLQIELPSGDLAWISKAPVETRGEVDTLIVVDPNAPEADSPVTAPTAEPLAETEPITSTAPVALAEPLTTTAVVTETTAVKPVAEDLAAEITVGLIGVKARTSPSLTGERRRGARQRHCAAGHRAYSRQHLGSGYVGG